MLRNMMRKSFKSFNIFLFFHIQNQAFLNYISLFLVFEIIKKLIKKCIFIYLFIYISYQKTFIKYR